MLLNRIRKLEAAIAARAPAAVSLIDVVDYEAEVARMRSALAAIEYDGLDLPLEQLLALARDDQRYASDHPAPARPTSLEVDTGEDAARFAALAAREFEIRILERDARLDVRSARVLRENAEAHFLHSVLAGEVVSGITPDARVDLALLPSPIIFDEAAALADARATFPRRSTLPAARRLQIVQEEHAARLVARSCGTSCADANLDAFEDRLHQLKVAELQELLRREAMQA